jgi:hypothetical protein
VYEKYKNEYKKKERTDDKHNRKRANGKTKGNKGRDNERK